MGAVTDVTDADFDERRAEVRQARHGGLLGRLVRARASRSPRSSRSWPRTHGDKVTFVKMDTNTNPVTPANNHVLGLPTIQVYVGGELVKAFKGAKSKSVLLGAIEEYL